MKPTKEKNVYIACSMIKSKGIDFSLLEILENWTTAQEYDPFTPGRMGDATPQEIFYRDFGVIKQALYVLADVNEPSHGVGMELMYSYLNNIPVIGLLHENNKPVSRMVEGSPNLWLIEYSSETDLQEKLSGVHLNKLELLLCETCSEKTIHHKSKCIKCD